MLVMSRRQGDTILIGDDIEIVISHIGRSKVKVGIRAPRAMSVVAREVKLVGAQNRAAASALPTERVLSGLIAQLQPLDAVAAGEPEVKSRRGRRQRRPA